MSLSMIVSVNNLCSLTVCAYGPLCIPSPYLQGEIFANLQNNGSLSTTEKLESFLESAPKGLVLKVVTKGDSNLEVGQLVDGLES